MAHCTIYIGGLYFVILKDVYFCYTVNFNGHLSSTLNTWMNILSGRHEILEFCGSFVIANVQWFYLTGSCFTLCAFDQTHSTTYVSRLSVIHTSNMHQLSLNSSMLNTSQAYFSLIFFLWNLTWANSTFFLGTVFREPIICRNIPRIVPGNVVTLVWIWFMMSYHWAHCLNSFFSSQVGKNPYVLAGMLLVISIVLQI